MNPGTAISFAGSSLQTSNILTASIDHFGFPTENAKLYPLAHANASAIPYIEWPGRTIKISGTIFGSSITDLDSRLDSFKYSLLGTNQNLDIGYNGGTRRYIATTNSVTIDRPGGLAYAKFQVAFVCTDPFGRDTSSTTAWSATGLTTNNPTNSYTFLGTAPYQRPIITVTYTAISSSGSQYMQFGNGTTGQVMTVTRSNWATSDVIVIDCTQKTVTANGVATVFTGAFPEFAPGAGTLQYYDSFTSRTFNITVTYTVRYL